jgi:hypothetical protein
MLNKIIMKKNRSKLFKPGDVLFGLLIIVLIYLLFFWFKPVTNKNNIALVQINDKVCYEINLDKDQIIKLKEFNPSVEVEVKNNAIRISRNDCEKKICLKMGFISNPGQMIICVPKKILIYIPIINEKKQPIRAITG